MQTGTAEIKFHSFLTLTLVGNFTHSPLSLWERI